ncbi:MAG TPA: DUF2150 family protein [Archaeoglobaceae archaeon]|nr:DUF2150 family protein [Archaeoglobaceae archaeon]
MEYYSENRYNNWINRIKEAKVDLDNPDSIAVFDQMMEDFVVACINILRAVKEREIKKEQAFEELEEMRRLISESVKFEDPFKTDLYDFAREGLKVAVESTKMKLEGKKTTKSFESLLKEALKKEKEGDFDGAFQVVARMGVKVLAGEKLPEDIELPEDGFVLNWLDGLDAINTAMILSEIDAPSSEELDEE